MLRVFCTCHQEEMLVWGIYLSVEALLVKYKDLAIGMIQVLTIVKKKHTEDIFSALKAMKVKKGPLTETFIA